MKLFHLSDLHIGLKIKNRDLREDQEYIFEQIARKVEEEKPDAVIIAGDIYDKSVPSAESYEIFDKFLEQMTIAAPNASIMMISGNHDNVSRVNVYRGILSKQKVHMIGMPPINPDEYIEKVVLQDEYGEVNFYLLPFVKPSMVKLIVGTDDNGNNLSYDESIKRLIEREKIDCTKRNVLVSHQFYLPKGKKAEEIERMDSEIRAVGNVDEVSADVLESFDYAALGHIHKPIKVGSEFYRYCGTPLACSVSEAKQEKGIIMVEMSEKGNIATDIIPLSPLREVKVIEGETEEVLQQACEDYVSIILTDKVEKNVFDLQTQLHNAFPNLLEVTRKNAFIANYDIEKIKYKQINPYELCLEFLGEVDDNEKEILKDVINSITDNI